MEIIGIVLIVFVLFALIAWAGISRIRGKPASTERESEDEHTVGDHLDSLEERMSHLDELSHANKRANLDIADAFDQITKQVDQLARVQLLILKELKKEHQIQPQKDVLVTIEQLPKNKERSA